MNQRDPLPSLPFFIRRTWRESRSFRWLFAASMGYLLLRMAMQAALLAPERVARLILVGSTPSFAQREGWTSAQPVSVLTGFTEAVVGHPAIAVDANVQQDLALFAHPPREHRVGRRLVARPAGVDTRSLPHGGSLHGCRRGRTDGRGGFGRIGRRLRRAVGGGRFFDRPGGDGRRHGR